MTVLAEQPAANGVANGVSTNGAHANGQPEPTHPGLVHVHRGKDSAAYDTYATSEVDLPAGALFAPILGWTPASKPTYATVQTGPTSHLNLNSDLVYINHSCAPSLEFHVDAAAGVYEVRVSASRPLRRGDLLSFFYPSSEWDMAQKFDCHCREAECWGVVGGAAEMSGRDGGQRIEGYFLNPYIRERVVALRNKE